jgi:hypothetical protein
MEEEQRKELEENRMNLENSIPKVGKPSAEYLNLKKIE